MSICRLLAVQQKFSLNRFNDDAMADILLPRAVGYAAGFLDTFFRGYIGAMYEDERLIFESAPFCNNTFGCPYNLKPELADKLRRGMLELDWKDTQFDEVFSKIGATQFVPIVYQTDFSLIRDIDNAMERGPASC